jgi:chromosome segregation ATPase
MSDTAKDFIACVVLIVVSAALGGSSVSHYYDAKIAEMEKAQAEAIAQAEKKNAQGLSKATDTINLASAEYNDLRAELDRARARLRHANSRGSSSGDSADALNKRVAELEGVVQRLVESGSECGRLYQRCASNHDALAEAVK